MTDPTTTPTIPSPPPYETRRALRDATLAVGRNKGGRPKLATTKAAISLRLDPDVLDYFRATGPGWQTRIHDVLKAWARRHARRTRRQKRGRK